MSNVLEVKNLNKKYKTTDFSLNNISFNIKGNQSVGFIGRNGAGKSTTIKAILGGIKKESGEIKAHGRKLNEESPILKEDIGVVFDDLMLPKEININKIDNIFKNIYTQWSSQTFFNLLKRFELPNNQKVESFSRGMSMKLSLAVALSHLPKLLILDEATAGLDPAGREEILEILDEFTQNDQCGILMSSHITSDIESISDKLIFIKNGEIILNIGKDELTSNYTVIDCNKEDLNNIKNKDIVAIQQNNDLFKAVISDKKKYINYQNNQYVSIDDIAKIFMRGEIK